MRALCLPLLLSACAAPQVPDPATAPRPVQELGSWELRQSGALVGRLVLLEIQDPRESERWYRVENQDRQWVGWISPSGRFWRRVPFAQREQFVGAYPMAQGLALLLEQPGPIAIEAVQGRQAREAREAALKDRAARSR